MGKNAIGRNSIGAGINRSYRFVMLIAAFCSQEGFSFRLTANKTFGTVTNSAWSADIELKPDGTFILVSELWQHHYNSVTRTTSRGRYTLNKDILILVRGRKAQAFRYYKELDMRELGVNRKTEGIVTVRPFVWGREFENLKLWKTEVRNKVLNRPKQK